MSELRANTITASDGTGPVTLTKQHAAKSWARYGDDSVIADSFNVASTVDSTSTTGATTVTFTNNMSNGDYPTQATCNGVTGDRFTTISSQSSSSYNSYTFDGAVRTELPVGAMVNGDLA